MRRLAVVATLLIALASFANAASISAKAWLAQGLIRWAWQATLEQARPGHKPWPWADTWPVAVLRHPYAADHLYVLEGGFGAALAFGPGHVVATAMPGEDETTVIAGHRDTHFRFVERLQRGDMLELQDSRGQWHHYGVASMHIVDSREGAWLLPEGEEELHLITCYPFDAVAPGGPLRYVVIARKLVETEVPSQLAALGLNADDENRHNERL